MPLTGRSGAKQKGDGGDRLPFCMSGVSEGRGAWENEEKTTLSVKA
nr:MAG TPA: hypothetical protein [Caudoviricetes sp.]